MHDQNGGSAIRTVYNWNTIQPLVKRHQAMFGTEMFCESREIISSFQGTNCSREPKSTPTPHRQWPFQEFICSCYLQHFPYISTPVLSDIFTIIEKSTASIYLSSLEKEFLRLKAIAESIESTERYYRYLALGTWYVHVGTCTVVRKSSLYMYNVLLRS